MILLNPLALLLALTIGMVLLLHFRRPRRIQHVSNLHLWQTPDNGPINRRPILEKIRRNWLLILQVLFLAFAILAVSRPSILLWEKPRFIAFVIDCSASMNAREDGRTRFDLAIERAIKLLDGVGENDRILVVQGRPQIILNIYSGADKGAIRKALKDLSATEAPADLEPALVAALASIQKVESGEIFVFSDGTQKGFLPSKDARAHFIQIGKSDNNAAITRFSIRSNPFSPYDQEIYAEVTNFSDRLKDFQFEIDFEGATLISEKVELAGKERRSFAVKPPQTFRGIIRSTIDVEDDLDVDNSAYAVLDQKRIKILLVTVGNEFLEKALNVNPRVLVTKIAPEEYAPDNLQGVYDLVILDGFEPKSTPAANCFMIKHTSDSNERSSLLYNVTNLVSLQPGHPVMTYVNLEAVVIEEAFPLRVPSSGSGLIEGNGKPLLTASETGAFRNITLGFDIHSSNLPLTLSFPVLISNIVNWLSFDTANPGNQTSAGAVLRWRVPVDDGGNDAMFTDPVGKIVWVPVVNGMLSFRGTERTGIYTMEKGKTVERFAINLLNEKESNIKPTYGATTGNKGPSQAAALSRTGKEVWRVLLFVSLVLLLLEWLYYQKRRSV